MFLKSEQTIFLIKERKSFLIIIGGGQGSKFLILEIVIKGKKNFLSFLYKLFGKVSN